jgi:phage-related minor tail protein
MSVELSKLVFTVDTNQLTEAISKYEKLVELARQLAKPTSAPSSPVGGGSGRGGGGNPLKPQLDLLTKLADMYKDLASGATRWEASQLRAARQMGVPLEDVREQLAGIRKLSQDPFDSAIGSVRSITQHFEQLQNRISLANEGLLLTAKQMREFSRIPFEVEGQMKAGGKDPKLADSAEYVRRIKEQERVYLDTAKAANVLSTAEKDRSTVLKQNVAANKFLTQEMMRVDAVLAEMNSTFGLNVATGERAAAAVSKYSVALQRAGVSGAEASTQLEKYRKKVQEVASQDEKRAATRLSRSLTPQISDVAVSVAGGMPLHLVIMQQGLQIRDLIAQSGVATEKLQTVFKTAASDMVRSIGGTVSALGALTFGALADAGRAVVDLGLKFTGLSLAMDSLSNRFPALAGSFNTIRNAMSVLMGVGITGLIAALGTLVYQQVKLISANDDLTRSLAVTGNVFGVTKAASSDYINNLTNLGATTLKATEIIGLMSDAGTFSASQISLVGKAAIDMERYGGVAIKDTIKAFQDLAKDPVKVLTELAIKTGDVSPKVLQLAYDLEQQGRKADLVALAMGAMATQTTAAVARMERDLTPLTNYWISFKQRVDDVVSSLNRLAGNQSPVQKLTQDITEGRLKLAQIDSDKNVGANTLFRREGIAATVAAKEKELKVYLDIEKQEIKEAKFNKEKAEQIQKNEKNHLEYLSERKKADLELKKLEEDYRAVGSKIDKEDYDERKKKIQDRFKKKEPVDKSKPFALTVEEQLSDAYISTIGRLRELLPLEKKILDIRNDPMYKKQGETAQGRLANEKIEVRAAGLLKLAKEEISTKSLLEQIEKDRSDIDKEHLEDKRQILIIEQKLSANGAEYERQLASINRLEAAGMLSAEKAAEVRLQNLIKFSQTYKFSRKQEIEDKGTSEKFKIEKEDFEFTESLRGKTEKVRQQLQNQYDLQKRYKQLDVEYLKEVDTRMREEQGVDLQNSLVRLTEFYIAKRDLVEQSSEAVRKTFDDDYQRQIAFNDVFKKGFGDAADILVDFAATGKSSFGDMIKSMLIDLAKLELRMSFMKAYESASAAGGSQGIFGLIKSFFPSYDGGGYTGNGSRSGGVDGKGGYYAVMHPQETVIDHTKGATRGSSGTSVQVVINNNSGAQVSQKETVDSRGNRRVEVTVGEMIAGEAQRSGSSVQRSIGQTFGMRPSLLSR